MRAIHLFLCIVGLVSAHAFAQQSPSSNRPPQFVLMAFDGSLNLGFWQESRNFATRMNQSGHPLKFTYFMSGVYFLADANKSHYDAPHHGRGKSAIGFGGPTKDLPFRVEEVNQALLEGHEMGSHANGHFDGGSENWSEGDWLYEFTQFTDLIFNLFSINNVAPLRPEGWLLKPNQVIGFRAPQLGVTSGLWPALAKNGFRYDTSKVAKSNYWPEKSAYGLWNFPLASLTIAGTGKRTLSMDYNFYVAQSGAQNNPGMKDVYKKEMLNTYLKYFQDNYNGNRAPVNIGHHFSKWNGGAYWEAMQEFAQAVCGLPEVRCATYKEYVEWLESANVAPRLAMFRQGQFEAGSPVHVANNIPTENINVAMNGDINGNINAITAMDSERLNDTFTTITVNGRVFNKSSISGAELDKIVPLGATTNVVAQVYNKKDGREVARATQKLINLGSEGRVLGTEVFEDRALQGDLPEAHDDERMMDSH